MRFFQDSERHIGNSQVVKHGNETKLYLFGNLIAEKKDGWILISNAGYCTNTTKERLNGILSKTGGYIKQKNGMWYLNIGEGEFPMLSDCFIPIKKI